MASDEPIPCLNCITYPICISRHSYILNEDLELILEKIAVVSKIVQKCSIMRDYIYSQHGHKLYDHDRAEAVFKLYLNETREK